jgi:hypothetical protein
VTFGVAGLLVALTTTSMAWATVLTPPTVVVGGAGNQVSPTAAPGAAYIAYSASRRLHPNLFNAYVKPLGSARVRVNAAGTTAFTGGIDANTLAFQQISSTGQSNIKLFDLTTHAGSAPLGVNTPNYEWQPTISGNWILFGRANLNVRPVSDHIVLHNQLAADTRMLDQQVGSPDRLLSPGQVNGDFATWDRYTYATHAGTVFRYQISTLTAVKVLLPVGKIQYASSTNPAGDIFYVRSGMGCGKQVVIREDVPGVSDVALAVLPAGFDIVRTFAVDEGGGVTSLYFDRFNCATGGGYDIYKMTVS